METYNNNYTEKEDKTLWELHEIRNKIHQERKNKKIEEINKEALNKYLKWKKQRERQYVKS
ncbi:hypothetical protein JW926_07610 [Candidatus Sumerlaeota bacterium]|nr:hypothetical protein [Candidatus Sumerlaeota bacterium]